MLRSVIEAGYGLPYLHRALYYEIASLADYSTGIAGRERRISIQGLSEALWIEPAPGRSESGKPSRHSIRKALNYLTSNGYLVDRGPLVFEVVALARDRYVQNQWAHKGRIKGAEVARKASAERETESTGNDTETETKGAEVDGNGPVMGHTSDIDDDLNGGAVSVQAIAGLFENQFPASAIYSHKALQGFREWIAAGADLKTIQAAVDAVLARPGAAGRIMSPKYFHNEVMQRVQHAKGERAGTAADSADPLATWRSDEA